MRWVPWRASSSSGEIGACETGADCSTFIGVELPGLAGPILFCPVARVRYLFWLSLLSTSFGYISAGLAASGSRRRIICTTLICLRGLLLGSCTETYVG